MPSSRSEILHIRHHSLYTPRDFDISPFFAVVKPTIETGFDYKKMMWDKRAHRDDKRAEIRENGMMQRRPLATPEDRGKVVRYAVERIGYDYDLKNIIDLMRYFLPQPPVPARWRRRMIALGSGEPTRAICSTLIAQAFESVGYPILPEVRRVDAGSRREIMHIRHHSLYAPRDFDISPFFAIVKPTIETGFDYKQMMWDKTPLDGGKTS